MTIRNGKKVDESERKKMKVEEVQLKLQKREYEWTFLIDKRIESDVNNQIYYMIAGIFYLFDVN